MSFEYSCFISYKRNEGRKAFLEKLIEIIKTEAQDATCKNNVFYDIKTIRHGDEFDEKIYDSIPKCYFFIPIYQNSYLDVDKTWCARELYHALKVEEKIREKINSGYNFIVPLIQRGTPSELPLEICRKNAKTLTMVEFCLKSGVYNQEMEDFELSLHDIFKDHFNALPEEVDFSDICDSLKRPTEEEIKEWIREQKRNKRATEASNKPLLSKSDEK